MTLPGSTPWRPTSKEQRSTWSTRHMRVYLGLKTSALARSLDYGVQRCRAGSSDPANISTRSLSAGAFLSARDLLLTHRTDYTRAVSDFRWPSMESFNWALDYIDAVAARNASPALVVVDEDGTERNCTFQQISERSSRVASFFQALGMKQGDRLLLMLGNEIALWETFLACMKLGVVVIPATTLLAAAGLGERCGGGPVDAVVDGWGDWGSLRARRCRPRRGGCGFHVEVRRHLAGVYPDQC